MVFNVNKLFVKFSIFSKNIWWMYHLSLLIVVILLNYIWFKDFSSLIFAMDDPTIIKNLYDPARGFLEKTLFNTDFNRFRPIFSLIQFIELEFFGKNYKNIVLFNIFFNSIIIVILYYIIFIITRSKILPFLVAILYITSRFSYYNITEFNGILEALCIFFLLGMILFSIKFYESKNKSYFFLVLLFYFLIIFTHERYLVLFGYVILMLFMIDFLSITQKLIYSVYSILIVILNILLKKIVFSLPFFVGTGSSHEMGFEFNRSLIHFFESLLNVIGYSNGPIPFNIYTIEIMTRWEYISVILILFLTFIFFIRFFYQNIIFNLNKKVELIELKLFLLFLFTVLLVILSFSLTIRVEQRWLYAPYVLYIIYFAYIVNKQRTKYLYIFFLFFMLLNVGMNYVYKKYTNDIFFIASKIQSNIMLDLTINKYGKELAEKEIYIIDSDANNTIYLKNLILANSEIKALNIVNIADFNSIKDFKSNTLIYVFNNGKLSEIPNLYSKNFKNAEVLSGTYYFDGGGWITKDISFLMNSGRGEFIGSIFVDNIIRLPNKLSIYINNEEIFSIDIVNIGETSFKFDYLPNKNVLIKIKMEKAIIPYELGLGPDRRELSVILKELSSN